MHKIYLMVKKQDSLRCAERDKPIVMIQQLARANGAMQLTTIAKNLEVKGIDYLTTHGAQENLYDIRKEKGLLDDTRVRELTAEASLPKAAVNNYKQLREAALEIFTQTLQLIHETVEMAVEMDRMLAEEYPDALKQEYRNSSTTTEAVASKSQISLAKPWWY